MKGRVSGGTGDPQDLNSAQATSLLDPFTATLEGLAPASGGGTTNFLRADGTWAAPTGGGSAGDVVGPASASDKALARFNTTTGKLIQNSGIVVSDGDEMALPAVAAPAGASAGTVNLFGRISVDGFCQPFAAMRALSGRCSPFRGAAGCRAGIRRAATRQSG